MDAAAYLPLIDSLERAPNILVPLVREVPAAIVKRRPQPGRWKVHEHACHLAAVQPLFVQRLGSMLREGHPAIRPYRPDHDDPPDGLLLLDLDEAMVRFQRERGEIVARLRELRDTDWERTAEHDEYVHYSVFIMFRHLAMHDMLHAYRIEELLLKKDWPYPNDGAKRHDVPGKS